MLDCITSLLYQKGYRPIDKTEGGILFREDEDCVFVLLLSIHSPDVQASRYAQIRSKVEFDAAMRFRKPIKSLFLIAVNDAFDESVSELVEHLEGCWIVSAETGRIYIFEQQSNHFDQLYEYLETGMKELPAERKKKTDFSVQPITILIVAMNVVYFIAVIVLNQSISAVYDADVMLQMGALSYDTAMQGAWYQLLTSMFMHFGIGHLFNNMVLLTYVGCILEKHIGKIRFLILYLGTGLIGNVCSLWYHGVAGYESVVSAGASGAVFGIMGALIVYLLLYKANMQELSAKRLMLVSCLTLGYGLTTMGVDNAAHIGGFVSGILGVFLLSKISQYGKLK